eukprot:6196078-Pleurochrysis_carterae.AAC.1
MAKAACRCCVVHGKQSQQRCRRLSMMRCCAENLNENQRSMTVDKDTEGIHTCDCPAAMQQTRSSPVPQKRVAHAGAAAEYRHPPMLTTSRTRNGSFITYSGWAAGQVREKRLKEHEAQEGQPRLCCIRHCASQDNMGHARGSVKTSGLPLAHRLTFAIGC